MAGKRVLVLAAAVLMLLPSLSFAITITATSSADDLVNNILGPGVSLVGAPTLIGITNQQGTFTDGLAEVGFPSGIVLSSGNVNQFPGANSNGDEALGVDGSDDDDINTPLGQAGDADLTALSGNPTFDANVLTFDFQFGDGSGGGNLFFNFVFASEEYIDFIGTDFSDALGFFLDGTNIALIGGAPITINNINNTSNSGLYVNNVTNPNAIPVAGRNIAFDGLTTVLQASAMGLGPGVHTISLKVADATDDELDSGVFIQQGTFSTEPTPTTPVPEPGTMTLLGLGIAGLLVMRRLFDFSGRR